MMGLVVGFYVLTRRGGKKGCVLTMRVDFSRGYN